MRGLAPRAVPTFRQFRLIGVVQTARERRVLRLFLLVALVSGAALVVRFGFVRIHSAPTRGGTYAEGIVGAPALINPVFAAANDVDLDLVRLLYAGLLRVNASGGLEADLAESWDVSSDGKEYRVTLREGLRWSDGSPLTADDVLFTFTTIKNPEWKSPLARSLSRVAVAADEERGLRFTLEEPFSAFAYTLTTGIIPEKDWGDIPPATASLAEFNIKPIGSGPYRFKALTRDRAGELKTYTVERNPFFHGAAPYLDRITIKFFQDFESVAAALTARLIDGAAFLPLDLRAHTRGDLTSYQIAMPQLTAVFFNLRAKEFFGDQKVRAALVAAVDRERVISDALKGEGEGLGGPLPPNSFPGVAGPPFPVNQDLDRARTLLDQAGWKIPLGGTVREKVVRDSRGRVTASSTLSFVLTTVDRSETVAAARTLVESWNAIGASVTVAPFSSSKIQKEAIRPRGYDALLYGEIFGADPDPYPFWHSSQAGEGGLNLSGYKNRDVDSLLEAARKTLDPAERAKKYTEFQRIVALDVPAVFLYRPFYAYLVDRAVRGVDRVHLASPSDRWNSISGWYRKTRPTLK